MKLKKYLKVAVNKVSSHISNVVVCIVWFVNGFICKVLNLVPRHQDIVARILGEQYSPVLTRTIGVFEMLMVVWILTRLRSRVCAIFQMAIIATMNVIEYILAPDLLLFGRLNILFASMFIGFIYFSEFILGRQRLIISK